MTDSDKDRGRLERAESFVRGVFDIGRGVKEIHHALSSDKDEKKDD